MFKSHDDDSMTMRLSKQDATHDDLFIEGSRISRVKRKCVPIVVRACDSDHLSTSHDDSMMLCLSNSHDDDGPFITRRCV